MSTLLSANSPGLTRPRPGAILARVEARIEVEMPMKTTCPRSLPFIAVLILGCALFACGGVDLKPEQQALVDKYERLIDTYEPKFAAVREDQTRTAELANAYTKELELWLVEFKQVIPTLTEDEALAIKASVDKLSQRSVKMTIGG